MHMGEKELVYQQQAKPAFLSLQCLVITKRSHILKHEVAMDNLHQKMTHENKE